MVLSLLLPCMLQMKNELCIYEMMRHDDDVEAGMRSKGRSKNDCM